ncbi:conoporin-Cn1-like [Misgurnus anguillicaudatus]|uniref:conoporin-Cn1-like n=1 Tax=Misgurnus anguillicaudatus TaxID=75329 RepID=UPI0024352B04|nr:DELTA-stichotoxin-Hcr4a-like [Misgurnus anguillicaudatus]XP_055049278.1 DELTA-stichotoxin-Hcr4a-like [Misgurnus anguillicaudatus]
MGGAVSKNCTIQITNLSDVYKLIKPQVYTSSGYCCDPPQPTISSNKTEVCTFTKTPGTTFGAVGVLTYDLFHMENQLCTERIAIMFSVPNNYNLNNNIMGVGVFENTCECDKALYQSMYEGKDAHGNTEVSGIIYKAQMVELRATMSNADEAIIKVEIHDNKKIKSLKTFNL